MERPDGMTLDVSTNDHSKDNTVQSMWSPETENNDRWAIYESMGKTALSRTPPYRAHSRLQPCSPADAKHNRRDWEPEAGYKRVLRGLPGGLPNARSNDRADQAPGGPTHTDVRLGDLLDLCERVNGSRVTRYVHPVIVGHNRTFVWRGVATPALTMALHPPTYNSKYNGGVEPHSPPTIHTEPNPHENATDDRKLTHGGLEPCSPPENRTTTTVRSPAPRPRPCPNHTIQHAYTRYDEQVRPLHTIVLMMNIITCLFHNGDGGVEPCSPPVNNAKLATYMTNTTNHGQGNGGVERCSPPGARTPATV